MKRFGTLFILSHSASDLYSLRIVYEQSAENVCDRANSTVIGACTAPHLCIITINRSRFFPPPNIALFIFRCYNKCMLIMANERVMKGRKPHGAAESPFCTRASVNLGRKKK